ncbi:MAG: plastocyanin/azurin family copper-binding protein [Mycobacteriales bacterium]
MNTRNFSAALGLVALLSTACGGGGGDKGSASRTLQIGMVDTAYQPTTLAVARGEKVTFTFANKGTAAHDAYVGDVAAQAEHEKDMATAAGHGGGHGGGDKDALTVDPGKTGSLTHTFDQAGVFEIGCHQPGHYASGMKLTVTVA